MKNPNIFLVHTEYHLLLAVNIIFNLYQDRANYIYIAKGRILKDFNSNKGFLSFKPLPARNYGNKQLVKEMLNFSPERFFYFQENSSDDFYLSYHMHKAGVLVALTQDGTKPYHSWKKNHLLLNILMDTAIFYKEMFQRHAVVPAIFFHNNYKNAYSQYIGEVWLTFPDKFNNKTCKKLVKIPGFTEESIKELNTIFEFNASVVEGTSILYMGQPLKQEYWQREKEIVEDIMRKFPEKRFIYKVHPNTLRNHLAIFEAMDNVQIFRDRIPAELFILSMNDALIISTYSTSMLTEQSSCHFYWTHNMFEKGKIYSQKLVGNPTSHIVEINSVDEIVD